MSLFSSLAAFGLRQVLGDGVENVVDAVRQRFRDHSQTLPKALERAHDRAWKALAVSLAGDGLIDRVKVFFASGDDKGVREQVASFLQSNAASFWGTTLEFRSSCLDELKRLRKSGRLSAGPMPDAEIANQAGGMRRHADAAGLVEGANAAVGRVADALAEGYPSLARLLRTPTAGGPPLLVAAFCFFFRREVETDDELAHGLFFDGLRQLSASQAKAFAEVGRALASLGDRFDDLFDQLGRIEDAVAEVRETTGATHGAVLDIQAEMQRLGGMHLANAGEVRSLLEQVRQHLSLVGMQKGEVRPQHSFSIQGEDERLAVKALLARFRELPEEDRRKTPGLLNGLGKLQVGAGDLEGARETFDAVAAQVPEPSARAEASYNAYRAALEQRRWPEALVALRRAAELDAGRFAPFPLHRYEPRRILGAGGFGTAVLCHDRNFDEEVVVKTLHAADLERGLDEVFSEARTLRRLSHPAIIGVRDCEYADPVGKARPYLVMDYFAGGTLEEYVLEHGPLAVGDFLAVAGQVAGGMQAAHRQGGVLHRDLKPANVLVRKEGGGWQARIIDFGLALRKQVVETSIAARSAGNTILSDSVAGTLKYAPPEQMGRTPGMKPGTYSDVYSFGKTCCYALFRTTEPKNRHWSGVPKELAEMLERCTDEDLGHRHASFETVLAVLVALDPAGEKAGSHPERHSGEQRREQQAERGRQEGVGLRAEQEQHRRQQEQSRRLKGEEKLASLVRAALDNTHGKPTAEDTTAAKELCLQHGVPADRAKEIVKETWERWQRRHPKGTRPGEVTTVPLGGGIEMKFAWCPPGTFLMGSPASELERSDDETQHRVTLTKGYWLGVHPVTQAQWQAVMGTNPSKFEGDTLPVETVLWDDCQEFVKKLSLKAGKRFRLPTEAEWEYACRAGTTTPFHFGETISPNRANYGGNRYDGNWSPMTTPVGRFPANAWGLTDVHGNVWEWCSDWFGPYPPGESHDPQGANRGDARVRRGGSWGMDPGRCRSAYRLWYVAGLSYDLYGCRVLLCPD